MLPGKSYIHEIEYSYHLQLSDNEIQSVYFYCQQDCQMPEYPNDLINCTHTSSRSTGVYRQGGIYFQMAASALSQCSISG